MPARGYAGPHDFVVYAPGMGGTQQQAKPYLETFFRELEKAMGWAAGSASGDYFEEPKAALGFIQAKRPGFGMLAPGLYMDLACKQAKEPLDLVASIVGVTGTENRGRYHVVVKDPALTKLEQLEGKRLSSNHLQNLRFVSRVIFAGKLQADKFFKLEPTVSPVKPIKQVDRGEIEAALLNDAQLEHMKSLPFGQGMRVLYSSQPMPPFPVISFGKIVKPADRDKVRKVLLGMCAKAGDVCKSLQITRFDPIDPNAYKAAIQEYCKP